MVFDEDGKPLSMTEVQPSAYARVRMDFEATEHEWRMCQGFVAQTLPSIEDMAMWKTVLVKMHAAVQDWVFLRLMAVLEDALNLAIETHVPGHAPLATLNDKLRFADDLKLLSRASDLHRLKKARNEFMHTCQMNADVEADDALDIIAAELEHLGFGPVARVGPDQYLPPDEA